VWPETQVAAPYALLAATFDALDRTRSRLLIAGVLAYLFRTVAVRAPAALAATVFLCTHRIVPPFVPCELGVGGLVLSGAVSDVTGRSSAQLRAAYTRLGDMGDVALEARAYARPITEALGAAGGGRGPRMGAGLTIPGVHRALLELAATRGSDAVQRKRVQVRALLVLARDTETRWLVRTLLGNLRVGAVDKTVVTALAHAFTPWPAGAAAWTPVAAARTDAVNQLAAAFARRPDFRFLVLTLLDGGVPAACAACNVTPGSPLIPMLGRITRCAGCVGGPGGGGRA
jgi:DNA ligase 1